MNKPLVSFLSYGQLQSASTSVDSVEDLRTGGRLFEPSAHPKFFQRIDEMYAGDKMTA